MARRIRDNPDLSAASGYDEMFDKKRARSRAKGINDHLMHKLVDEVREIAKSTVWTTAQPKHFVALFEWMHEEVYGIESFTPPVERLAACSVATSLLRTRFDGNPADMADFFRWVWSRERGREKWRRENQHDGGRITWRIQFSLKLYGDYRLSVLRGK